MDSSKFVYNLINKIDLLQLEPNNTQIQSKNKS